jgi:hypothetical protein
MYIKLFKKCSNDCILKFCNCIKRVAKGEFKLKTCHLKKLVRHKRQVRNLVKKSTSLRQRQCILQRGEFLSSNFKALLLHITDGVAKLIGYTINKGLEYNCNK